MKSTLIFISHVTGTQNPTDMVGSAKELIGMDTYWDSLPIDKFVSL